MFSLSKQVLNITRHARIVKKININAKLLYIRYDREQNRFYSADAVSCASEGYKKGIILGHYLNDNGEPVLTPACCKFNEKMQGRLLELIVKSGKWTRGQCRCFNNIEDEFWSVACVCLGKKNLGYNILEAIDESRESVREAAGAGAQGLHAQGVAHIFVEGLGRPEQAAEGTALGVWRYQEFKNKKHRMAVPTLELYDDPDHESWQRGLYQAEAQNLARRLCDAPANHMTPTAFSHEAISSLCPCGIKVDVHDKDWMESQRLVGFLTAARGSCEPPVFMEIHYCGGPVEEKPIALVGKSTTFDSGGLCLKPCYQMSKYRADMSGGAAVVAVMRAAAMLSLPINIVGTIALSENLPSGMAMRVGDIVKYNNGLTVEIQRTDQEGHLILADSLLFTINNHKPRLVIDMTTMTRGIRNLLGSAAVGTFSNSEYMWKQIRKAGVITGDRCWRLPLWKFYKKKTSKYTYVDLNNRGHGQGTPCLAAAYLSYFIDCVDWLHLDTTGIGLIAQNRIYPYLTKDYMMGRPVRTVIQLLYQLACPNECDRPY